MDEPLAFEHADKRATRAGPKAIPNQLAELYRRRVLCCNPPKKFAVIGKQRTAFSAAQTVRLIQDRVKHRRQVARRGIDDTQHLSSRGLLLQRLAGFADQPRVLHCDDRLRRKVLQQCDLLLGKGADFTAVNSQYAEQHFVATERNVQHASEATDLGGLAELRRTPKGIQFPNIGSVDQSLTATDSPRSGICWRAKGAKLLVPSDKARVAMHRGDVKEVAVIGENGSMGSP